MAGPTQSCMAAAQERWAVLFDAIANESTGTKDERAIPRPPSLSQSVPAAKVESIQGYSSLSGQSGAVSGVDNS